MALKLLDVDYLRALGTTNGQVIITTSSFGLEPTSNLIIKGGMVGIGSAMPTHPLSVSGNVAIFGADSGYFFPDGSKQTTSATTMLPGGPEGAIQYNYGGVFSGNSLLIWDQATTRLGIGTSIPKSTMQIRDVGYESTSTFTSGITSVELDRFPVPDYRSCHYIVQVSDLNYSTFHTSQIMLIHDGITAYKSEYNVVVTDQKLGEFDCLISGGDVVLTFQAFYTSDKNIKVIRTSIEP
jgi:hypothetical protein